MEIKQRLSYQFTGIVAIILVVSLLAIYFSFAKFRSDDFNSRLSEKARYIIHLLVEIEEIDADLIGKIELNSPSSLPDEKLTIYDLANNRIFDNDEDNSITIDPQHIASLKESKELRFEQEPYEVYGYYYEMADDSVVIFVAAHDIFGYRKLKTLRIILLIVFSFGLVLVYFSGKWFASKALAPISRVIKQASRISGSNLSSRLDEGNKKDEIAKLAITFNEMLSRIEAAFVTQKSFISNASHELRNPLTSITGQLEVLLIKDRSVDAYKKSIESILEDIRNVNQISDKLLMLARTSSKLTEYVFLDLRIDDLVWKSVSVFEKQKPEYVIKVEFGNDFKDDTQFIIKGNEFLLISSISNLIENGCKYSDNKEVVIQFSAIEKNIVLDFIDQGIGIPDVDKDKIFEPFFRAGNAKEYSGHGIGLSIVQKIIQLHHGKITIDSKVNRGTKISISLPLRS
ncbi:MAG: HAMP domain-containing histidine kinase [Bacteroidales bacterium]|nr:HAMP domain-containing histidine kinase [Bacteroidales bacterium]MCF8457360.1 HAMP domain-containing histidine kinase [Bacteroidales bacterium]